MKRLLIILLVAVLHHVNADGQCSCATFLRSSEDSSRPDLTSRMYLNESGHVDSCEGDAAQKACSDLCIQKIGVDTDDGNLNHVREDGKTVADFACSLLHRDVHNGEVAAFSKLCGGDWVFAKASTPQYICCTNEHSVACT